MDKTLAEIGGFLTQAKRAISHARLWSLSYGCIFCHHDDLTINIHDLLAAGLDQTIVFLKI
jgi:hypothetical protein